jgi:acetyltransferase-like isoleucine patch superfamily enzyme
MLTYVYAVNMELALMDITSYYEWRKLIKFIYYCGALTSRMQAGHIFAPTKIGSNVWVGANSVICPGVSVGDNSIIVAGSVVTKNVNKNTLIAGNPAKPLRSI